MKNISHLQSISKLLRYDILTSTTAAGSGHPTSSLSAVELMAALFFGGFLKYDIRNPQSIVNDRVIFSKGHASPLLYSLYHAAGAVSYDELLTLRKFDSVLEGHPTPRFKYVDVSTGSLGQGLSIGLGMALGIKLKISDQLSVASNKQKTENRKPNTKQIPKVFVLLGDSEMAEGQIWEAMEIASYYKLNNLIAILDVNRLGQRGETMLGWNVETYAKRVEAFGWKAIIVEDGHDLQQISDALQKALQTNNYKLQPKIVIAKTIKGKGVSFLENKDGWHGKAVPKDKLQMALGELGKVDLKVRGTINLPNYQLPITPSTSSGLRLRGYRSDSRRSRATSRDNYQKSSKSQISNKKMLPVILRPAQDNTELNRSITSYMLHDNVATREAYGEALSALGEINEHIVALDAETSNSTYADKFAKKFPDRFFEMFIAEQNMISTALGLSKQGFIPFASSFAAFLTRAFDQIRMAQYSAKSQISNLKSQSQNSNHRSGDAMGDANEVSSPRSGLRLSSRASQERRDHERQDPSQVNLKIVGSHAGVSIGSDGPSQMALEDLAMMRSILHSTVFYPSDAVSTFRLTEIMAKTAGLFYMRTTREKTPVLYKPNEEFKIGGSKLLRQNPKDVAVVFAAGITVHEALKAADELKKEQIFISVVDLYSIKPIDHVTIQQLAMRIKNVIVVEDHYPYGGIGEAVLSVLSSQGQGKETSFGKENGLGEEKNTNFLTCKPNLFPNPNYIKINYLSFTHLCVRELPRSGSPQELLTYEEIDSAAIVRKVKQFLL